MIIALYIIFGLSLFFPFYTYFLYPLVLKLFRDKKFKNGDISPSITAIVCFGDGDSAEKVRNIESTKYPKLQIIVDNDINSAVSKSDGKILVFLDNKTKLDKDALNQIVKSFADERVDMVVGEQTCKDGNSVFWKYEKAVRKMESKIGSVSGANNSLFAVRKNAFPNIPINIKNVSFYISTKIKQNGDVIIYNQDAKTYESKSFGNNFQKHVREASGFWQAFLIFWKMLLPRKGSFIYVSHRVMKWFLWLNVLMIIVLPIVAWLVLGDFVMEIISIVEFCFIVLYLLLLVLSLTKNKIINGAVKILNYFISINIAFLIGLFRR